MSPDQALTGWALALAYALPVGLLLALLAQVARGRIERRRAERADAALRGIEAELASMPEAPASPPEAAPASPTNGRGDDDTSQHGHE